MKNYVVVKKLTKDEYYQPAVIFHHQPSQVVMNPLPRINGKYFARASSFGEALLFKAIQQAETIDGFVVEVQSSFWGSTIEVVEAIKAGMLDADTA